MNEQLEVAGQAGDSQDREQAQNNAAAQLEDYAAINKSNSPQDREQAQKNAALLDNAMEPVRNAANPALLTATIGESLPTSLPGRASQPTGERVGEIGDDETVARQDVADNPAAEMVTAEQVKAHPQVHIFMQTANDFLGVMGYTEHGLRHGSLVGSIAHNILQRLEYPERDCELGYIAGYIHDIGNVVNRHLHAQSGALIAHKILSDLHMEPREIAQVIGAIGNHDEGDGHPVSHISAALIVADKSDVHRSRVRSSNPKDWDIHDRVNWSTTRSFVRVDAVRRTITLEVEIDTSITQVMEYFEIFLSRMLVSRRAAQLLECQYHLLINDVQLMLAARAGSSRYHFNWGD